MCLNYDLLDKFIFEYLENSYFLFEFNNNIEYLYFKIIYFILRSFRVL